MLFHGGKGKGRGGSMGVDVDDGSFFCFEWQNNFITKTKRDITPGRKSEKSRTTAAKQYLRPSVACGTWVRHRRHISMRPMPRMLLVFGIKEIGKGFGPL